mmetsp:Transcript_59723/g.118651  ORF Transcript_59723/g.118651 Transcript_59723/m.118651 type:complete len:186 (+) Transcript_59723:840-1397(+)
MNEQMVGWLVDYGPDAPHGHQPQPVPWPPHHHARTITARTFSSPQPCTSNDAKKHPKSRKQCRHRTAPSPSPSAQLPRPPQVRCADDLPWARSMKIAPVDCCHAWRGCEWANFRKWKDIPRLGRKNVGKKYDMTPMRMMNASAQRTYLRERGGLRRGSRGNPKDMIAVEPKGPDGEAPLFVQRDR